MSVGAIAAILFVLVLTIALPLGVMVYLHKQGGRWLPFLVGTVTFPLFALGLEQAVHALVLGSSLGTAIKENILLYALYGGAAAGVFEELGRFAAFKLVLREHRERLTALCYGVGHGGIEAFLLVGVTMANNLFLVFLAGCGGQLPPELESAVAQLMSVPARMFLWAGFERAAAIGLHMANSVLVFAAVTRPGKLWLLPVAIGTHTVCNFLAVTFNAKISIVAAEAATMVCVLLTAALAARIYKNLPQNAENS